VEEECSRISAVLVQNKVDLINDAQMTKEEVEELANKLNMKLYRTCVKTNTLVSKVFEDLAEMVMAAGLGNESDDEEDDGKKEKEKEKEKPKEKSETNKGSTTPSSSEKSNKENGSSTKKGKEKDGVIKLGDSGGQSEKQKGKCCA